VGIEEGQTLERQIDACREKTRRKPNTSETWEDKTMLWQGGKERVRQEKGKAAKGIERPRTMSK